MLLHHEEILHLLKLTGTFYCQSRLSAPWGVAIPGFEGALCFVVVTHGRGWLEVGDAPPFQIGQGDLVLVTNGAPLGLRSAYAVACGGQEPAWSTWKKRGESEAKHTIDYILASPDVEVRRVLLAPDEATVEVGRLPCFKYPSDHIAIAAEFNVPV